MEAAHEEGLLPRLIRMCEEARGYLEEEFGIEINEASNREFEESEEHEDKI